MKKWLKKTWKDSLRPKSVFIPYFAIRIIIEIINIFTFRRFKNKFSSSNKRLCIEAGSKGWELIDVNELFLSSSEYLGKENVHKLVINKESNYIDQVKRAIIENKPTHYIYDARTGSQNWLSGLIQAFRLAIIFQMNAIVPICVLTDLPVRSWRCQCAVVSAKRGVVMSLMSPKDIHSIFPHSRIIKFSVFIINAEIIYRNAFMYFCRVFIRT